MQRRRFAGLGVFLLLGMACNSRSVPTSAVAPAKDAALQVSVLEADAAAAEPTAAPEETDPRSTRATGPFAGFAVPKEARLARVIGFSADDTYLGYEFSSCDPCPQEYDFVSPNKPPLRFGYLWDPAHAHEPGYEARRKKHDDAVDAKVKQLSPDTYDPPFTLRGPFPYPDLAFAYEVERDDAKGIVIVRMGLRVQGEDPVLPIRLVLGPHPMRKPRAEDIRTWARLPKDEREKALREYEANFGVSEPDVVYMNVTKDGS